MHDLAARRSGVPLWRHLDAATAPTDAFALREVPVYASGINPDRPGDTVGALRRADCAAFKLKVGFGEARDLDNLAAVRAAAGAEANVMVDANQAWDLDSALAIGRRLAELAPGWIEEPLRAGRPWHEWQRLAQACPIPLVAGENAISDDAFDALIASRAVAVVQPDLAKWGSVSGVLGVIDRIAAAGLRYCPHYLGAGIGLLASAHVLAARARDDGMLEVDANENPLRTLLCPPLATLRAGRIALGAEAGLGIVPDLAALRSMCEGARTAAD